MLKESGMWERQGQRRRPGLRTARVRQVVCNFGLGPWGVSSTHCSHVGTPRLARATDGLPWGHDATVEGTVTDMCAVSEVVEVSLNVSPVVVLARVSGMQGMQVALLRAS
jgi:hypothetical protein